MLGDPSTIWQNVARKQIDTHVASALLCSEGKEEPLVPGQGQVAGKLKSSSFTYADLR